ncbi:hypothetical protein PR202_ga22688 [Eleusine coracana subsp. coracana]|uniref:Uncharacterized protein n=1 Tax=Eleusine coracana subsp. coracana TaxID=191504 RepID=A0AAV5D3C6_ELECO|nr:hypothetical protein PR202_ga22688 [Eleusine coracana subsp. coracana]
MALCLCPSGGYRFSGASGPVGHRDETHYRGKVLPLTNCLRSQPPHLFPHSVRGIFVNYQDHNNPHFFARPKATPECPQIDDWFDFIKQDKKYNWTNIVDHSNGLALYFDEDDGSFYVCNPLM